MSAWVVSKAHIDVLVGAAMQLGDRGTFRYEHDGTGYKVCADNADRVGRMLIAECVTSVSYRYPGDDVGKGELPGPIDAYYNRRYRFEPVKALSAAEIVKAAACYDYQSCEHPGWEASRAHALVHALVAAAGGREQFNGPTEYTSTPDYEAAPWGFDEEDARIVVEA